MKKNKQKSIILNCAISCEEEKLNQYLDDGWIVKQIAPVSEKTCTCIVIIEKEEEEDKKPLGFGGK